MTDEKETATEVRLRCMMDRQFRRWHETLKLKNENTADSYRMWVVRLTRLIGLDPLSYVRLFQEDPHEFDDATQDILNALVREGKAEATILSNMSALKHWSDWCRCKLGRKLVMGKAPRAPVASRQRIPAPVLLRRLLDLLDPRSRACMAFRAFAGLRPGILANYKGTSGLRLKHIEGLTLTPDGYSVEATVLRVVVPSELSKNGLPFFTFLGQEGIDYLTAYLDKRIAAGETLAPESPVIAPAKGSNRTGETEFLNRGTLTEPISRAMKTLGLNETPYIWRSYFKTQLIIAQSKKGLLGEYVEFWMGHNGGIQATYSFRKEVSPEVLEEMRLAYEVKALPFLQTRQVPGEDHTREDLTRIILESFDVPADIIDGLDLENVETDELREVMREHRDVAVRALVQESAPAPHVGFSAGPMRQFVVHMSEVQGYVAQGWRYVYEARLPEGQALVEAPLFPRASRSNSMTVASD